MVGGNDTLAKMEELEVDQENDRPKHPPKILETVVFKNPFAEIRKKEEEADSRVGEGLNGRVDWCSCRDGIHY